MPWLPRALRPLVMFFAWNCSAGLRRNTLANAARLLGPASPPRERTRVARAVVRNFYDAIVEMGADAHRSPEQLIARLESAHGVEHYAAARAARRGAVLATAHLGAFEAAMAMLARRERRVHVVFRPDRSPAFERLRAAWRAGAGVLEAPADGGLETWARLRDALLADEVVLMQADRVMPGQRGARTPFVHGHVELPLGPVKLARLAGSPIVPVFAVRGRRGVRVFIEPAIWPGERPGPGDTIDPALAHLARVLERYVAAYPDQWLRLDPAWIEDRGGA